MCSPLEKKSVAQSPGQHLFICLSSCGIRRAEEELILRDSKRQEGQDEAEKWNFSGFQEPGVMRHPGRLQMKVIKKFPEREC